MRFSFSILLMIGLGLAAGCINVQACRQGQVMQIVDQRLEETGFASFENLKMGAAIRQALTNNRDLKAAYETIGIAQADLLEAGLLQNPLFTGQVRFPDTRQAGINTEFSLTQNILDLFLIPLRKRAAAAELEKICYQAAGTALEIAFEVEETFYRLQAEQSRLDGLSQLAEIADLAYEISQRQQAAGTINLLELHRHRSEKLIAALEFLESRVKCAELREKMNRLMGFGLNPPCWKITDGLDGIPACEPDLHHLEHFALDNRLELLALRWEIEGIARTGALNQWWTFTDIESGVSMEKDPEGILVAGPALSLRIPIFNGGQAARERILGMLREKIAKYESLQIQTVSEVRKSREALLSYREIAKQYESDYLPLKKARVAESLRRFNVMTLSVYELLDSKKEEIQARLKSLEALRDYWLAKVALEKIATFWIKK